MESDELKATTLRWIMGIWNQGDFVLFDQLASERYAYEAPGLSAIGGQQFRDYVFALREAFPDIRNTIQEQVAEANTVVTRGTTTTGTQRRAFGEIPATGKMAVVPWVMFTTFENGRVIHDWELYDALGFMNQLGVFPSA